MLNTIWHKCLNKFQDHKSIEYLWAFNYKTYVNLNVYSKVSGDSHRNSRSKFDQTFTIQQLVIYLQQKAQSTKYSIPGVTDKNINIK